MERELLGTAAAQLADRLISRAQAAPRDELAELTGMVSGPSQAPDDPGLKRLFPDFEPADKEEVEGENSLLRQLHEPDILKAKLEHLRSIIDHLGPDGSVTVTLTAAEAPLWVAALNDIRLQLHADAYPDNVGGPDTDPDAHPAADSVGTDDVVAADHADGNSDAELTHADVLIEWLGFCQDSLLSAMMGD